MTARSLSLSSLADSPADTFPAADDAPLARALLALLARGEPVTGERLAAATKRPPAEVNAALASWPNVHRDGRGAVVAFSGLTLRPTEHRFRTGGRELFAWCAWDTLFLPALLEQPADVRSTCPLTATLAERAPRRTGARTGRRVRGRAASDGAAADADHARAGMTEMTIGQLARRTGLSVKAIREYEARGLIYTVGRSAGNYRLFDDSALWCAQVITGLRAVGLTVKEIARKNSMRRLAAALDDATCALRDCTEIGPTGVIARIAVGVTLILLALFWNDPSWADPFVGLVVIPHVVTAALALRARHVQRPLRATGPPGHMANAAVFVPLFAHPATVGAALLFYGGSMLVAAARRSGGCELTAISNLALDRDDQVGCVLFAPLDLAGARRRRSA
jgi:hypothetical protein